MQVRIPLVSLLFVTWLLCAQSFAQSRIYVDADQSGPSNGASWATAFDDLQDGIFAAAALPPPREIWIADGVYRPDRGTLARSATFLLPDRTTLLGGFRGTETAASERDPESNRTVLDGDLLQNDGASFSNYADNSIHIITILNAATGVALDGLTLQHGNSNGSPYGFYGRGALYGSFSVMQIINCRFTSNLKGGAGLDQGCNATFTESVFAENSSDEAAGLIAFRSSLRVDRCTFERNASTSDAGALRTSSIDPLLRTEIVGCRFFDNTSGWRGGALFLYQAFNGSNGFALIEDCEFANNRAIHGGAIYFLAATPTSNNAVALKRSRFRGNRTDSGEFNGVGDGGALYVQKTGMSISDCAFERNTAAGSGGAIHDTFTDRMHVANCLFASNRVSAGVSAGYGGGWRNTSPFGTRVTNCVFVGNVAPTRGGGMTVASNTVFGATVLANCTFVGNSANEAGGLWVTEPSAQIWNCVLWGNSALAGTTLAAQVLGASSLHYCDVEGWDGSIPGVGNLGADPLFENQVGCDGIAGTADDNLRLSLASPCRDVGSGLHVASDLLDLDGDGNVSEPVPFDIDRLARFAGSTVDLGAYESQGLLPNRYCVPKTNSLGCVPRICSVGRPTYAGVDGFQLLAYDVLSHRSGLLIWGLGSNSTPFAGGVLCVQGPTYRVPVEDSGGSSAAFDCSGTFRSTFSQAFAASRGLPAGARVYVQFLSRDPGYAQPNNFGLTDAIEFELTP
jgi:hypothetical protein